MENFTGTLQACADEVVRQGGQPFPFLIRNSSWIESEYFLLNDTFQVIDTVNDITCIGSEYKKSDLTYFSDFQLIDYFEQESAEGAWHTLEQCFEQAGSFPFTALNKYGSNTVFTLRQGNGEFWSQEERTSYLGNKALWQLVSSPTAQKELKDNWVSLETCFEQAGRRFPFEVDHRGLEDKEIIVKGKQQGWIATLNGNHVTYAGTERGWRLVKEQVPVAKVTSPLFDDYTSLPKDEAFSFSAWLNFKPKTQRRNGMFKELSSAARSYVDKNRDSLFTFAIVILADHFLLGGKLRARIEAVISSALARVESSLAPPAKKAKK